MYKLITSNCKECGSDIIVISNGYHTCAGCGFVSEDVVLGEQVYYSHENETSSYLSNRMIGNSLERIRRQYTSRMYSMIKLDCHKNKHQSLIQIAREKIKTLLFILRLPEKDMSAIFTMFKDFHPKIIKGNKFKNPEKLVPCIIFVYYKYCENRPINSVELINYSKINRKELNNFLVHNSHLWAGYNMDKQSMVLQLILKVTEEYKLGMDFYYQSEKILLGLWEYICDTTEQILAGFACSLTILCIGGYKVRASNICEKLNISMSNISKKFKDKIVRVFKLENYRSLVKSAELIKRFLIGLSLIDSIV
ncbi:MAG: hypothetical protein E3J90_08830 [Promethearchaeota archaeon]|nr:MAG: hypothetical protein E3J90_08830 [Candidatus Lokiarchaeota archaeon]